MSAPQAVRPGGFLRGAAAVLAGVVLALGSWPLDSPAGADSPVVQTWWTANNVTVQAPLPPDVVAPGAVPPVTIPSTDVPDGGSEVAGTTSSPTGALTLRYEFDSGSQLGALVLTVAAEVPVAPGTELVACALTGEGTFESYPSGGPITQLPAHDCASAVPGVLNAEATSFTFDAIASLAAEEHLAVVILPVAGRAVLERALGDSLPVVEPERSSPAISPRPVLPSKPPAVAAPGPFLGQVQIDLPAPAPAPVAPAAPPTGAGAVAPELVKIFRGTPAGQAAGSATAGAVLLLLAASRIWRKGRAALLDHGLVAGT